jgi:DNA-binding NarL/FixJ family response regulator
MESRKSMGPRERIRVALIEDKRLTREGLGEILGADPDLQCVGLYPSVEAGLPGLEAAPCDVLLLDIHLPGMSGVEGVRVLKDRFPEMRILMLTVFEEEEKVFDSICNGATGYLLKKSTPAQIVEAVREARRGNSPLSPEVARQIVGLVRQRGSRRRVRSSLTPQELALVKLLAEGHSYQSAAERLDVTINTVRDRIRSVYEKLQVHSKSEAVSKALRRRLIE